MRRLRWTAATAALSLLIPFVAGAQDPGGVELPANPIVFNPVGFDGQPLLGWYTHPSTGGMAYPVPWGDNYPVGDYKRYQLALDSHVRWWKTELARYEAELKRVGEKVGPLPKADAPKPKAAEK